MTRPFTSKDFADVTVEDLKFRLVDIPSTPRRPGVDIEKLKLMTPEELRVEFAQRLNDGRLRFSTYTHKHLDDLRR
jgi:hypothetical protein